MAGGLLRLGLAVAAVLAVIAGLAELGLRAAGVPPRAAGELSRIVPDPWTGFRLRPGVTGEEPHVTNDLGMHAPHTYPLGRSEGTLRVAMLGSSVVYGLDTSFRDTIPGAVERELRAGGHRAEVLNFGTHGFTIVNVSALLQAYVHQFEPDVVVVVVDVQVALPRWPPVRVGAKPDDGVEELGAWQALLKRGAARSALLAVFDDPRPARRWIRRASGLPLRPRASPAPRLRSPSTGTGGPAVAPPAAAPPAAIRAHEETRERELAAPLAAMAAFCAEKSIAIYFVTPYGAYFDLADDELARMEVDLFLEEAIAVHGTERRALVAEVELVTRVLRRVGARGSARIIDMLEASRAASLRESSDFAADGIHLTATGNAALGRTIARRILADLDPGSEGRD